MSPSTGAERPGDRRAPVGQLPVLDDAADHKVKRIVVLPGQAAQLPASRPARRALVHRVRGRPW